MTDSKRCLKCQRPIDAISSICPFCNWDQALPAPPPEVLAAPSPAAALYTPPDEFRKRNAILILAGIVVMLVGSFTIGMIINSDDAPDQAPETLEQQAAEYNARNQQPRRADTPLVPAGVGGIDQQPITSAPVLDPQGNIPNEYQRTDATAVSAVQYAQMARRAQDEKRKNVTTLVDPRTLSGPAYAQGARIPAASRSSTTPGGGSATQYAERPASRSVRTTRPIAEYQPVPRIRSQGKARLTLIVGADGRVRDVNIERTLPGGNTAALVGAVQRWRFKPATVNGEPVAAPYSVEISFGRE
jgi:TonB family protein